MSDSKSLESRIEALERELYKAEDAEREKVRRAMAKAPEERTNLDWTYINYSPWGRGQGCSCGC